MSNQIHQYCEFLKQEVIIRQNTKKIGDKEYQTGKKCLTSSIGLNFNTCRENNCICIGGKNDPFKGGHK